MISDRIEILMNGEIDGVNTAAQSAELEAYLAANPADRAAYLELCEAVGVFVDTSPLTPPPTLRGRILAAVETEQPVATGADSRGRRRAGRNWRPIFGPRAVFAGAAAVVLLMVLLNWVGTREPGADRDADGWYRGVQLPVSVETSMAGNTGDVLVADGVRGEIRTWRLADGLLTDLHLEAAARVHLQILVPAAQRVETAQVQPESGWELATRSGTVDLRGRGFCTLRLKLAGALQPANAVTWRLSVAGKVVTEGHLPPAD